jgi:hypothetical protein
MNGDMVVDVNDCIGPAGAGVLVEFDIMSANVPLTGTCQQMTGAEIWINVPGAGNVTFIANVDLNMVHAMGTEDSWRFVLDNTPADCLAGEWNTDGSIPSSWDSGPVEVHDTVSRGYSVPGPGTLIVYLNGYMLSGSGDGDELDNANMVAVYYPS